MLEKRTVGDRLDDHDTEEVLVRYIYSNHLQSASLELDEYAAIISYEEYHPYGTTSFQSNDTTVHANAKRYRYTGKERDEESGLYYHGARYYIPWLCRWSAVDPLEAEYAGWSPYHYVKCNPVMDTDSTGMGGDKDPIAAPTDAQTGQAVKYTDVFNTYDLDGNLISTFTSNDAYNERAGEAHGLYVHNRRQRLSASPQSIKDGSITYASIYEYVDDPVIVTPYYESNISGVGQQIWDAYKMADPIQAGAINGAWNFSSGSILGMASLVNNSGEAIAGVAQFAYYTDFNSPGRFTAEGIQYNAQLASGLTGTWNKFKNGDAYTKTSMLTETSLTLGSMFLGGGEGRYVGWSSRELKFAADALKAGKGEVTVASKAQAEELLLNFTTGDNFPAGFRNTTNQILPKLDEFGNELKKSKTSDWLPGGRGAFDKRGTYHWDLYNPYAKLGDHASQGSHLQIHNFDGSVFRIFFNLN